MVHRNDKITVEIYEESAALLQIIENDPSDPFMPTFGKKGWNSKSLGAQLTIYLS